MDSTRTPTPPGQYGAGSAADGRRAPTQGSDGQGGMRLRGAALASVLISLMLTLFLAALDQTIVATATPKILRDLNGYDRYIWPVTAYLVA